MPVRRLPEAAVPIAAALLLASPRSARAAGVDEIIAQAVVATFEVGEKDFGEVDAEDGPSVLQGQHVVVLGTGAMMSVGLRGVTQTREGNRFGLAAGYFTTEGLGLRDLALPADLHAGAGSLWGGTFEASLGKAFLGLPVLPYIDLRLVMNVLHVDVELASDTYGSLGKAGFDSASVSVGPRLGLFIPVGNTMCIDFSGTYGIFGVERAGFAVGLGLWDGLIERASF